MPLLKFDNTLSVNVKEIDEQHKKLIDIINRLFDAMKAGKSDEVMDKILNELIDYTSNHFTFEERLFDKFKYEHTLQHKLEHKKLVEQVLAFRKDFESGKKSVSVEIMTFLKDWLTNHIKGTDKKYSDCFNKNGMN